jgi:GNAT superfamily N-acetyltransferase
VKLIPASQFSIQELTTAYNQTRVDYLVPMPMTARRLGEYIADYDVHLNASVVALEKKRIIGLCMLGLRGRNAWITRLGVLPNVRRHGLGTALADYCIEQAIQHRAKTIYLEVIVGNTAAHQLFLKYGFQETRRLLVLRRPPGPPPPIPEHAGQREPKLTWLSTEEATRRAATRKEHPNWLNQVETFINDGVIKGLEIVDIQEERSAWVSYEQTPLQLRRVLVTLEGSARNGLSHRLLYHLHTRFATLDTIAENIPADASCLDAYYDTGYVEAFSRIEMKLDVSAKSRPKITPK